MLTRPSQQRAQHWYLFWFICRHWRCTQLVKCMSGWLFHQYSSPKYRSSNKAKFAQLNLSPVQLTVKYFLTWLLWSKKCTQLKIVVKLINRTQTLWIPQLFSLIFPFVSVKKRNWFFLTMVMARISLRVLLLVSICSMLCEAVPLTYRKTGESGERLYNKVDTRRTNLPLKLL